jgi:hypothetical protein
MMTHIISYGEEEMEEPTGGGTTTSETDPDWKQDSFIDNPVAEQVRECYRVYKVFKKQTSNTAAAKKQRLENERDAKNFRDQAQKGYRSPPPKVSPDSLFPATTFSVRCCSNYLLTCSCLSCCCGYPLALKIGALES